MKILKFLLPLWVTALMTLVSCPGTDGNSLTANVKSKAWSLDGKPTTNSWWPEDENNTSTSPGDYEVTTPQTLSFDIFGSLAGSPGNYQKDSEDGYNCYIPDFDSSRGYGYNNIMGLQEADVFPKAFKYTLLNDILTVTEAETDNGIATGVAPGAEEREFQVTTKSGILTLKRYDEEAGQYVDIEWQNFTGGAIDTGDDNYPVFPTDGSSNLESYSEVRLKNVLTVQQGCPLVL